MKKETKAIRTQTERSKNREHSVPLYLTSSFVFDSAEHGRELFAEEVDGNIYSRFSNPNTSEFITKMCNLENAEDGFAFSSGMAAVFGTLAALLSSGDHVLSSRALFGSSHQILTQILPKWGIEYTYVDAKDQSDWEKEIKPNTKVLFIETPSNPGLELIDLEMAGNLCKKHNIILVVDNCFATPIIQNPIDFGADLVTHSATKYIDGQGRVIGGITVGRKDLIKDIRFFARQTGPSLSPFNAWILSKSLETLSVRMEKHSENALKLAEFLSNENEIDLVKYPFLSSHPQHDLATKQMKLGGGIITINIKGGFNRAQRFIDSVEMASITANLGDTRTIVTHPASTTHSKLSENERSLVGINSSTIRISVGLENVEDIKNDIQQAIERSK
ncbi:MAG: aminotransferase class I/II-fold pyridoxal phosphate-dependent enzyme [Ignavibacteriae bacterium]|nr:aminotransferase class I/II-fold pyridoxal phosphate-dependent enzyme [Ignavibacteriota bacterium]MCB0750623.1 aminotransferase class I/II-fold pyridoxal phosphate-dependent enzyme [Ignavibacteriota bacterium]MCB9205997.1 aminotransferase class I/II-fold pyridoxal phosphate-dependent enzyme [Ignavibacteriales bacterium]MCB9209274.1 aminotransferase class I/II-fold pyridoxal phosphate-dependent enzyme [Ignavibacteriales bacterium]MCB9257916.1 aminotransferase class I/II-fold pyridoxal phospha